MSLFLVSVILLLILNNVNSGCNLKSQTCDDDEYCIYQRAKMGYPDPDNYFSINPPAYTQSTDYACNSKSYCQWAQLWNVSCIQIWIPEKYFESAFVGDNGQCQVIKAPITINETVSCCQPGMNCSDIFQNLQKEPKEESTWAYNKCPIRDDVAEVIEDVVDCYATIDFMKYIKCNQSDYANQCPDYFFNRLHTYARCACQVLKGYEDSGIEGSLHYFNELTDMIEGIFQSFRGENSEICPPWSFSCNNDGDAILDVYEIICPLELDQDRFDNISSIGVSQDQLDSDSKEYLNDIRSKVYKGTSALIDSQVVINTDTSDITITVIMYSEDDAINAVDWLSLNTTDDLPDEIIGEKCTLNDEAVVNLNNQYGDPTPSPTDNCRKNDTIFTFIFVCIISYFVNC